MSNYYMIVTNEIDYEWDIDNKFACAGFPDRNKNSLKKMQKGDKIVYYVTKKSMFMAVVDFLSEQFDVSRTSAKEMLHAMMSVKREDNLKKQFNKPAKTEEMDEAVQDEEEER